MSYLNINYSTLEDAWGSNFEKRNKKSRNSTVKSEVCDLYNKRNSKIYKPYKTSPQESTHITPIYTEDDYVKYHGYKDGRPFSKKTNKLSKYDVQINRRPSHRSNNYVSDEEDDDEYENAHTSVQPIIKRTTNDVHKKPYVKTPFSYIDDETSAGCYANKHMPKPKSMMYPIVIEQEDDDDTTVDYLSEPVVDNTIPDNLSHTPSNKYLYEIDYDDDFDRYFKTDSSYGTEMPECSSDVDEETQAHASSSVTPKAYNKIVKSAIREKFSTDEPDVNQQKRHVSRYSQKEKIHLDLALYTVSGVVLIFIMEQFIQIGMKIKAL